tara:strand:+ start:2830 stop:3537 length:708 start_codon:yes stop_codon:yes gene_type:complete
MKKIVITGGTGRFAHYLKQIESKNLFFFPSKKTLDITNIKKISKYFNKVKPDIVMHLAGLSRPMVIHEKEISKSINLNIVGTCNLVAACSHKKIKIIYFSTQYVYPGKRGNYKESDALLPTMNYGWSKLGGECAVQMYKNSLILRVCMTEKPFTHKYALYDAKTSFLYHHEVAKIVMKLINKKGIINIGGKSQTVYNFAKKDNPRIKKIYVKNIKNLSFPKNSSLNTSKLKLFLK